MKKPESKTKLKLLIEAKFNITILLYHEFLAPLLLTLLDLRSFGAANGSEIFDLLTQGLWSLIQGSFLATQS